MLSQRRHTQPGAHEHLKGVKEHLSTHCIVGNFGEVLNLANWQLCRKSPNLKPPILFHTLLHYVEALVITKFKICQCIWMTDSLILMLVKVPAIWYMLTILQSISLAFKHCVFHARDHVCTSTRIYGYKLPRN